MRLEGKAGMLKNRHDSKLAEFCRDNSSLEIGIVRLQVDVFLDAQFPFVGKHFL